MAKLGQFRQFARTDDGSVIVEYSMLVGAVSAATMVALSEYGQAVAALFEDVVRVIDSARR